MLTSWAETRGSVAGRFVECWQGLRGGRGCRISGRGVCTGWVLLRALAGKMGFSPMKGRKSAPIEGTNPPRRCPAPPSWLTQHAKPGTGPINP